MLNLTCSLFYRLSSYEQYDESESVTDTSEDSVEVRVNPVERKEKSATMSSTPSKKNKRKSMEPRKMMTDSSPMQVPVSKEPTKRCRLNSTGSEDRSPPVSYNSESRSPSPSSPSSSPSSPPSKESKRTSTSPLHLAPKKRFKFDALKDLEEKEKLEEAKSSGNPFRPWSSEEAGPSSPSPPPSVVRPPGVLPIHPFLGPGGLPLLPLDPRLYGYLPAALPPYLPIPPASPPEQDEPLCLVKKEPKAAEPAISKQSPPTSSPQKRSNPSSSSKGSPSKRQQPGLPSPASRPAFNVEAIIRAGGMAALRQPSSLTSSTNPASTSPRTRNDSGSTGSSSGGDDARSKQRNYKNMTRERRVEANARERQRVHTITAAFDNLQGAIPTEEENVKLSKLSVIKIATAYIMALSRMAGHDYTEDQSAPPVEEVIKQCSEVIEAESRIKKRSSH